MSSINVSDAVAEAALFAQLQPDALSKQEACLFASVKDSYFAARDGILAAWYRNPVEYLSFNVCMSGEDLRNVGPDLAWRAFAFLTKNGYINAGLAHAREQKAVDEEGGSRRSRIKHVSSMPVCPFTSTLPPETRSLATSLQIQASSMRLLHLLCPCRCEIEARKVLQQEGSHVIVMWPSSSERVLNNACYVLCDSQRTDSRIRTQSRPPAPLQRVGWGSGSRSCRANR